MYQFFIMIFTALLCGLFVFIGARSVYTSLYLDEYQKQCSLSFDVKRKYRLRKRKGFCYYIDIKASGRKYKSTMNMPKCEWDVFPNVGELLGYRDVYVPAYRLDVNSTFKPSFKEWGLLKGYIILERGGNIAAARQYLWDDAIHYFMLSIAVLCMGIIVAAII